MKILLIIVLFLPLIFTQTKSTLTKKVCHNKRNWYRKITERDDNTCKSYAWNKQKSKKWNTYKCRSSIWWWNDYCDTHYLNEEIKLAEYDENQEGYSSTDLQFDTLFGDSPKKKTKSTLTNVVCNNKRNWYRKIVWRDDYKCQSYAWNKQKAKNWKSYKCRSNKLWWHDYCDTHYLDEDIKLAEYGENEEGYFSSDLILTFGFGAGLGVLAMLYKSRKEGKSNLVEVSKF